MIYSILPSIGNTRLHRNKTSDHENITRNYTTVAKVGQLPVSRHGIRFVSVSKGFSRPGFGLGEDGGGGRRFGNWNGRINEVNRGRECGEGGNVEPWRKPNR